MQKIVLFGDSLFANIGKDLMLKLERQLPGYDVYNCATNGWDTNDVVKKSPYIAQLKPDILLISLGTNDSCPWKQVDLKTYAENIAKIFDFFQNSRVIYFLPPPVNEILLGQDPKRHNLNNQIVKKYHDAAREICEAKSVAYLNSWGLFMPLLGKGDAYHLTDGIHLSKRGYDILIKELAQKMESEQGEFS